MRSFARNADRAGKTKKKEGKRKSRHQKEIARGRAPLLRGPCRFWRESREESRTFAPRAETQDEWKKTGQPATVELVLLLV